MSPPRVIALPLLVYALEREVHRQIILHGSRSTRIQSKLRLGLINELYWDLAILDNTAVVSVQRIESSPFPVAFEFVRYTACMC